MQSSDIDTSHSLKRKEVEYVPQEGDSDGEVFIALQFDH